MKTAYPTATAMFALRADSTPEPGQRRARGRNGQARRSSRDGPVIKKEDDDDGVDADDEATVDGNATVDDDETIDENATEVEDESDDEEEYETPGTPTRGPRGPSSTAGNLATPIQESPSPEPESPVLKPALPVRRRLFPPSANRGNSGPPLPPGRRSVSEGLNNPFSLHGSPVSQGSWWRQHHTQGLGNLAAIQEHPERETGSFVRYTNPVPKSPLLHNSKTANLKGGDKESPAAVPKADEAEKTPAGYIRAPQKPEGKHMEFLRLNKDILAGKTSGPLQIPGKKEPVLPATTAPPARPSMADPSHGYNPRAIFDEQAKCGLRQPHGHLTTSTSAPVYQPYQPNPVFGHSTNHNPVAGPSTFGFPLFSDTSLFPSANPARIPYSTTGNMASLPRSNTDQSSEQSVSVWSPEAKRQEQEQKLPQQQQQPLVSGPAPTASSFQRGQISDSMIDPSLFSEATHQPQQSGQQGQPQQQADPQQQRQSVFHAPAGLPGPANLNVGAGFNISNLVHSHNFLPLIPNIAISGASGINDDVARQALENAESVEYQLLGLKIMSVAQGNSSVFAESSATHTSMDNASRRPQIGDQNNNYMNYESDQMEEAMSEQEYPATSSLAQSIDPSIRNIEGDENNHNINNTGMAMIENDDNNEEQGDIDDSENDSASDSDSDPIPHMPDVATAEMHNPLFNAAADYWLDTPEHWARGANGLGLGLNHALPRPTQINPFSVTAPPLPRFETDPYMPFAPWRVRELPPFHDEPTNRVLTIRARYLAPLGQLYPDAEFIVSRHPASKNFTARIKGRVLTASMAIHFPGLVRASPHVGGYASILGADNDDEADEENDPLYLVALAQRDWPIGGVAYLPHERRAKEFIEAVEQTFDVLPHGQEVFYFLPHRTVLAGGDDDSDEDGRNSKTKSSTITTSIGRSRSSRRNKRARKNNTKANKKNNIPDNAHLAKGIWVCRAYEGRQGPQHPQIITDWLQMQGGVVEQDAPGRKMLVHMGEAELEQATWSHGKRRVLAPVVPVAAAPAAAAGRGKGKRKGKAKRG
ncbi:hypothetical protein B0J18DRAFT_485423 [Chaetomium sp. MPI-SDFR-AT-0129]|nr:hypothetical protein B0J18DRAFT_485423 [Chaetomium sp. MPI-SDFR-AT-0129]